jgi:capsular polysaccharide biosynthesis protein/Mrp family chromosome partitioning ATPase
MSDAPAHERLLRGPGTAHADRLGDPAPTKGRGLDDALVALRRWWVAIAVVTALGAVAGGLLRSASAPSYAATAKVLLEQQRPVDALLGVNPAPADPTRELSTGVSLIVLEPVAERVRRHLGLPGGTDALLARVSAKLDGNTNIVDITANDTDPRRAAQIADAFATAFQQLRAESAGANLAEAVRAGTERLRRLGPGAETTPVGRELAGVIRRLEVLEAFQTGGVQVVRRAPVPASPSGMSVMEAQIVGGLLGALLAVGLAVLVGRTDRRLHDEDDVERGLGIEVLATIPRARLIGGGRRRRGAVGYEDPREDAFATLAARVAFAKSDGRPGVLLVAPAGEGEGTSDVVLGLVRALARLGRCALAIDADLRAARLSEAAGREPRAGLAALLAGDRWRQRLEDEVVELTPVEPSASAQGGSAWLLPAGPPASSSQALLGGPRMDAVIGEARLRADVVVIAGGPRAEAGHTVSLAHAVDAVLLVVRRGRTRQGAARRALRSLEALGVPVIGAALIGAPRPRRHGLRSVEPHRGGSLRVADDSAPGGSAPGGSAPGDSGPGASASGGPAAPHDAVSP